MRYFFSFAIVLMCIAITSFDKPAGLTVSSPAFFNNSIIPVKYSCEGQNVSPPMQITDIPKGTKSLALILHDPDAPMPGGFTHWVMWNMNISGVLPEDYKEAEQGNNSENKQGYTGMCPPSGTHHYHFKVYALDCMLKLAKNTDKAALEKAMQGHILAQGEMTGLYKK